MNIEQYYFEINRKSQDIFSRSMKSPVLQSKAHSFATDWNELIFCLDQKDERAMMSVVCSQVETASLSISLGLYRSAFCALRLGFEIGVAAIYFSANKLAFREWQLGSDLGDIKWSTIMDENSGVLSPRFISAFFPELLPHVGTYYSRSKECFRFLSEYVHGNNDTWTATGISLSYNAALEEAFSERLNDVVEILMFIFCCRYLKQLDVVSLDKLQPVILETFTHIEPIRVLIGNSGDIK
ncbi:hypothetical protein [Undibacterium sp. Di24W]|uniref:hypothetical protein n=1 Tax=Undibacterium sp. Di24W TaxID=3413033 RepID=UPI003BEF797F